MITTLIIGIILIAIIALFIWDKTQSEHAILRNYPIVGYGRYILEALGVYLRPLLYARDREELPFNRSKRNWVYRASKNVNNLVGFGSTRDLHPVGTIFFVNSPFPVLGEDSVSAPPITIGPFCEQPYTPRSFFNISAMSYGALSGAAITALSKGAAMADCWLNTGEGGLSPFHLAGKADLVFQIGTAKYGVRNLAGDLDDNKLRELAAIEQVRMFEVKLSQGAKPGKGGILPAIKVTPEIAALRGIIPYQASISPNRFPEISNAKELLDFIEHIRSVTGKPVGCKFVLGGYEWLDELCNEISKRDLRYAPDYICLDSADGGTGASPMSLIDYVGLPISESLPNLVDSLIKYGLRERIKVVVAGKLVTPAGVAWALCVGADFICSARGFMFSLGCIQALRCHLDTCPTGIATQNPHLEKGLDPTEKAVRVYNYAKNMRYEVGTIAHSCGVKDPRELTRSHARIMTEHGQSISLAKLYANQVYSPHSLEQ